MKIFGIGLPRTATTSLALAMLQLGYKTSHMCFRDSTYDRADAFFDTPIWADYKILDHRYPNSKFILMLRNSDKWYESYVKNLTEFLKFTYSWKGLVDPVNRRVYKQVFGEKLVLTKEHLLECYNKHQREVEDYFRDRPNDLLVMNIDDPDSKWKKICPFLGVKEPEQAFPSSNSSGHTEAWKNAKDSNKIKDRLSISLAVLKVLRAALFKFK